MDQNSAECVCLKNTFPRISGVKESVFVGPQRRQLMQDVTSEDQPSEVETQHGNH
jgi:hypothetical protein